MSTKTFNFPSNPKLYDWLDGKKRLGPSPNSITVTGTGFGSGPTVALYETYGGLAASGDAPLGEWDQGHYNTGIQPKLFEFNGVTGVGNREGGTVAATDNRETGFVKTLTAFSEYALAYSMAIPEGRTFSGASTVDTFPSVSTLKYVWLSDTALDPADKADIVAGTHNGNGQFAIFGNNAITPSGGTPDSLYFPLTPFDFNGWNHVFLHQSPGADPFVNNGVTEATWASGAAEDSLGAGAKTVSRVRTSLPTFGGGATAAQYTHVNYPAWSGNGSQDLSQTISSYFYLAVGANSRARIELINSADSSLATARIPIKPDSWTDVQVAAYYEPWQAIGMTHCCITNSAGAQTVFPLPNAVVDGANYTPIPSAFGLSNFAADPVMTLWDTVDNQSAYAALSDGATIPDAATSANHVWVENGTLAATYDNVKLSTSAANKRHDKDLKRYHCNEGTGNKGYLAQPAAMPYGHNVDGGIYVSWWQKVHGTWGAQATKVIRLWGDVGGTERYLSWTVDKFATSTGPWGVATPDDAIWNMLNLGDQWVRYETWVDRRNPAATVMQGFVNGTVLDQAGDSQDSITFDTSSATGKPVVRVLGWDSGGASPTYNAWDITDIYISGGAARYELSNSATWGTHTHSEPQPVTTWPSIKFFFGAHNSTDALYLHYINENNQAEGIPVLIRSAA